LGRLAEPYEKLAIAANERMKHEKPGQAWIVITSPYLFRTRGFSATDKPLYDGLMSSSGDQRKRRPPSNAYSTSVPRERLRFAKCLRRLRGERGYTQRAYARALEIAETRYGRYERAEVEPNLALLCRMCEVLRVLPNDLLGFVGKANG
jgi:DNA-binding XRE family transcriptional regulator